MSTQSNNSLVTYGDVKSMIKNSFRFNETNEELQLTINEDGEVTSGSRTFRINTQLPNYSIMFFSEIDDISSEESLPTEYFAGMTLYTQTHVIAPLLLNVNVTHFTFAEIMGPYYVTSNNTAIERNDYFVLITQVSIQNVVNGCMLTFKYTVSRERGFSDGALIKIVPRIQIF